MESDLQCLYPVSTSNPQHFGKVNTIWAASLHIALCVIFNLAVISVAVIWPSNGVHCDPLYIFLYIHVAFWFLSLIVDHYFKWRHHILFVKGYLEFSEELKKLGSFPFLIASLWNAIFLFMLTIYHHFNIELESACKSSNIHSPVFTAVIAFSVETVSIVSILGNYIYKVYKFHLERRLPDVNNDDRLDSSLHSCVSGEVGFKDKMNDIEELLEKQANLIKFLRCENEVLSKKIHTLNCQMRGESIN